MKYKCSKCGLKDENEYRFMKFKKNSKIYCEVCVSDLGDNYMQDWMTKNFIELIK